MNINEMVSAWRTAKEFEVQSQKNRREMEDAMIKFYDIAENLAGTENREVDGCIVKIVMRIDKKIDADKLQELAADAGLSEHLSSLFRWKPEINAAVWKSSDEVITRPLLGAITSKPGRPSFTITTKEI